jgi:hypothetical protein
LQLTAILSKEIEKSGGVLTDDEKAEFEEARLNLATLPDTEENAADRKRLQEILLDYHSRMMAPLEMTAESYARNETIVWWVLTLLCEKSKDKDVWTQWFAGKKHEDREKALAAKGDDAIYSPDELVFNDTVIKKAVKAVSIWFYSSDVKTQEEFDKTMGEI